MEDVAVKLMLELVMMINDKEGNEKEVDGGSGGCVVVRRK